MPLAVLIYASRATVSLNATDLAALTQLALRKNRLVDISGALLYCDEMFIQMLEGPEAAVRARFSQISLDRRHAGVQELSCHRIFDRTFPDWGMSFLSEAKASPTDRSRIRMMTTRLRTMVLSDELGDAANDLIKDLSTAIQRHSSELDRTAA